MYFEFFVVKVLLILRFLVFHKKMKATHLPPDSAIFVALCRNFPGNPFSFSAGFCFAPWPRLFFTRQVMEPTGNLVAYMPLMAHSSDPTLYSKDDFVPLLVERTPTLFWWILGKCFPLDHPYGYLFALNILIRFCIVSIVYRMVKTLAKDWRAGMIGVVLFSGSVDTVLGAGDLYWSYISHTPFSVPLLLLALYCLYRKRWLACFALTGLAYNIHILNAAYFSLFLFFWTLFQWKTLGWKLLVKCWGLAGIFALPVLPQTISGILQSEVNPVWQMHILDYHRQLLSPYHLPLIDWLRFGGYLLFFLLMLRKSQSPEENNNRQGHVCHVVLFVYSGNPFY